MIIHPDRHLFTALPIQSSAEFRASVSGFLFLQSEIQL
jgi:hypothetical protein